MTPNLRRRYFGIGWQYMEIRFFGHTAYKTEYHIIWIPKYRRRILNPGLAEYLRKIFPPFLREMPGGGDNRDEYPNRPHPPRHHHST